MTRRFSGIAASPGVAVGPVVVLDSFQIRAYRRRIPDHEIGREVDRFRKAIEVSAVQLLDVARQLGTEAAVGTSIIEAHRLILRDEGLISTTMLRIDRKSVV